MAFKTREVKSTSKLLLYHTVTNFMQRAKRGRLKAKIWLEFLCNLVWERRQLFVERAGSEFSS